MKISIIIATYNRCKDLKFLLESLKDLQLPDAIQCEVLVIDNNSTDCTKVVTESYLVSKYPKVRYIFEQRQGKSNALNTGIRQAEGDILVFTDDDCIPDSAWIMSIAKEFVNNPSLSALGGRVELYNKEDIDIATIYQDERMVINGLRQLFPPMIIGCNMAIMKGAIEEVGEFDPLLGPGSKIGATAEDVDLIYRIMRKGFKIVYTPNVLVYHNHGRRTENEIIALMKGYYKGQGAFYWKHIHRMDIVKMVFKNIYNTSKTLLKGIIIRKNFPYHKIFLPSLLLGAIYYQKANSFKKNA